MTIDKITSAPTPNEQINKINEIIDKKQDTLVSGTNIKTINNESILGSGNITIGGGGSSTDVQINGTSITSGGVANIVTEGVYDATDNKIATMSDLSGKVNYSDSIQIVDNRGSTSATHLYTYSTMNNALDFLQDEIESLNGDLNNKLNNTTPHIIDRADGSAGYRVYSDGWCVQWGYITKSSSNRSNQEITFLKEFASADAYTFIGHAHCTSATTSSTSNLSVNGGRTYSVITSESKARTGKKITVAYISDGYRIEWIAFGQLKSGEY